MADHIKVVTFHTDNKACLAEYIRPLLTEQEKKEINDTMWSIEDPIRPSLPCGTGEREGQE